jgi:hypothetical protein
MTCRRARQGSGRLLPCEPCAKVPTEFSAMPPRTMPGRGLAMGPFARSRLYCTLLQRAKPAEIVVDARKDSAGSFSELRLSRKLLETMAHRGITKPTEAQSAAMLEIQSGRDVMLSAETGSGKTLSYLLTLLNHSIEHPRGAGGGLRKLVLVPTNVLAHQLCGIQRAWPSSASPVGHAECVPGRSIERATRWLRRAVGSCGSDSWGRELGRAGGSARVGLIATT